MSDAPQPPGPDPLAGAVRPLAFGPLNLRTNLFLSPLAGYTNLPMRLTLRELAGNEIELAIEDFPTPHCAHCQSVLGWAEKSIELSGGEDVRTSIAACRHQGATVCRLRGRWS